MNDELILYHFPLSFWSQISRLALVEKGLKFKRRLVDITIGQDNCKPWYLRIHPQGVVPALVHGDKVVTETQRILEHMERSFPHSVPLIPKIPEEHARMTEWIDLGRSIDERMLTYSLFPKIVVSFATGLLKRRVKLLKKLRDRHPDLANSYSWKIEDVTSWISNLDSPDTAPRMRQRAEELLDGFETNAPTNSTWLAGSSYSLADVYWTVILARMEFVGLTHLWEEGRRKAVAAYYYRVRQRPSFKLAPIYHRIDPIFLAYLGLRKFWPTITLVLSVLGLVLLYLAL